MSNKDNCGRLNPYQKWFDNYEIQKITNHNKKKKNFRPNIGSKVPEGQEQEYSDDEDFNNASDKKEMKLFEGKGISLSKNQKTESF